MSELLIRPDDDLNRELVAHVHPPDWENPEPDGRYNLVVIGAGTAGLVTAAAAAGLGGKVALIERHLMGGDCLNVGCVPSKAVIAAAKMAAHARSGRPFGTAVVDVGVNFGTVMKRMRQVRARIAPADGAPRFRELGVDVYLGQARFASPSEIEVAGARLQFARAVIATGARAGVPAIDGLGDVEFLTNETVFELTELPARLSIIGAGTIGCELAQAFARFGSDVTVFDLRDRILPADDADAAAVVFAALERDGVSFVLDCPIDRVDDDKTIVAGDRRVASDHILVATGRAPNVEALDLETAGVDVGPGGVVVDDRLRTTNSAIYACGDVCARLKLTHAADAMARIVVRNALFFGRASARDLVIPWVTYTEPELAQVGLTAAAADKASVDIDTFEQAFDHVDRAICDGATDGFVRVHVHRGSDRIAGATVVGHGAGELISELTFAMTTRQGLGAIANTIHPYPTRSLALRQVADQYSRTRLTPRLSRALSWLLRRRR